MADQPGLSFGGLLRQLRVAANLTQEELAEAARLSPRSVSDLERGVNRTARKHTAELLAGALGLAGPARELFLLAARGRAPAEDVLAAGKDQTPDGPGIRGCPYRGLLPFSESDAQVFYGRERLAAELAAKVAAHAAGGGPVVVTGASGSGKSSLLRAGLVPILAQGQRVPGSRRWPRIVMTPTGEPLTELAAQLAAIGGPDALAVAGELARHPERAHLVVRAALLAAGAERLVLIVDQFEQVFTLSPENPHKAFITTLCATSANPAGPEQEPPAVVIIAVRGDFWDRCAAIPELVGPLQDGQFVVGPMTESELRVAITGPAAAAGLHIDPGLTEVITADLRVAGGEGTAAVLPLLSQAMALTWGHREGDRLTSHAYAQSGGVGHAVQTSADSTYDALPAGLKAVAQQVLRAMTITSRDGGLTRRPVSRPDLYAWLPSADRAGIDAVLAAFAAARLVVLDGDTAQLSHDVLLRGWPRLRRWLEEDQASWILHGQLADAAAAWQRSGDDSSFLYRGAQLAVSREAVTRWSASPARYPALSTSQRDFLRASARADAWSGHRRRGGMAALALLTVLAVIAAHIAFSQRAAAIQQRDQVIASEVAAKAPQYTASDPSLAAQLMLAAYRIHPAQDLAVRLLSTENTPLSAVTAAGGPSIDSVALSPDGHVLASVSHDGAVQLWTVAGTARIRPLGPLPARAALGQSVAFSPRGHLLAIGGATIQVWDVSQPAHPRLAGQAGPGSGGQVDSVAFSPDGHMLVTGNAAIRLWNVADPAHIRPLSPPLAGGVGLTVDSVAFGPAGDTLVSGTDDGTVQLWDVADPARPRSLSRLPASAATGQSVALSPDGRVLATGNGAIRLWDVTDPARPHPIGQPVSDSGVPVTAVTFGAGGRTLASDDSAGTVRLWDLADPASPVQLGLPLTGSSPDVESVAFSPDAGTLVSGGADGAIRLWDLPRTVLTGSGGVVTGVAFSADGGTLASGDNDGTIQLYGTADPGHPRVLSRALPSSTGSSVDAVAFSRRGHMLASDDAGGTVQLWDTADPARPRLLSTIPGPAVTGQSVAFSPSGHTLATGNALGVIQLYDIADPVHPRPAGGATGRSLPGDASSVNSLAFSPDGRVLASGDNTGAVRLWDVADLAHPRLLASPLATRGGDLVTSVAFSPDGHTLASASGDGTVRLWDVADPARPRPAGDLSVSGNAVSSVAFSPDGRTLASGTADGTVWLSDVTNPAHPVLLGQLLTGGAEFVVSVAFSPDGHTLASGTDRGTTWLWNLDVPYAINRLCATAGSLTPRQWDQYVPELPYQKSC